MAKRTDVQRETHERLLEHERALWASGLRCVAGLDEAGAGPLAGPVTAACVVLNPERLDELLGVNDSKKLSAKKRAELVDKIRAAALGAAVAHATVEEIDRLNIRQAGLLAMSRALDLVIGQLRAVEFLLVDAWKVPGTTLPQRNLVRGDSTSLSIAAASILAKVERDQVMEAAALRYPGYGFEKHKGYGTAEHMNALRERGATPFHRQSFAPVRDARPA